MALVGTIRQLQALEDGEAAKAARADRPRMVAAWRQDIAWVYAAIRSALKELHVRGLVSFDDDMVDLTEELLGTERYERMHFEIIGRRITVAPVARFTVGSSGRLDMYRANRPSEENRILVVRGLPVPVVPSEAWWIEIKGETMEALPEPQNYFIRGKRRYRVMEPSSIEAAVDYLLQLP